MQTGNSIRASFVVIALASLAFALGITDAFLASWRPHPVRLPDQFSAAFLQRVIASSPPSATVWLGDSALWGYKIDAAESAIALLDKDRGSFLNLTYEGGSLANSSVLLRVLLAEKVRPKRLIFNINVKEFNPSDSAYRTLRPSLATLALRLGVLSPREIADYRVTSDRAPAAVLNAQVERYWRLYRLRLDLREVLFRDESAAALASRLLSSVTGSSARKDAAHRPTADSFLGTYDLTPLSDENIEVRALKAFIALSCAQRIPTLAILTPTNHELLHDYIDSGEYARNLAYLKHLPACPGYRVVDLDHAFSQHLFIDNDHLTPQGQRAMALRLDPMLR